MPKIILTENQWKKISEITSNLGLVSVGSIAIPSLLIDRPNLSNVILGLGAAIFLFVLSLWAAKRY